jgi:hypothetical protein
VDVFIIIVGIIALVPTLLGPSHVLVYSSRSSSFRGLAQQEYRFVNPRSAPITGLSVDWSFSTPPDNGFIETVAPAAQLQKRPPTKVNTSIVYHFELTAPFSANSGFSILFMAPRPFSPPNMTISAQASTISENGVHSEEIPSSSKDQWDAELYNHPFYIPLLFVGIIVFIVVFHLTTEYLERSLIP